ncbi:MAG: hypothetical protein ABSH50_29950 [Bryobacteraceae bacterium]|jgi:hypothetical protein
MQRLWIPALILTAVFAGGPGTNGIARGQAAAERHILCGIVHKVNGAKFALETRTGRTVQVDATSAIKAEKGATVYEGLAVSAEGTVDKKGVLQADNVTRIKSARVMWPEDR